MRSSDLLIDALGRIQQRVNETVGGLSQQQLALRPDPEANSIAWLVWHLSRVLDDHVTAAAGAGHDKAGDDEAASAGPAGDAGAGQVWIAEGWHERSGLPLDASDTGYGHTSTEVAAVGRCSGELLVAYHEAVQTRVVDFVKGVTDDDLSRIIDRRWDPPVTLGVRLVSVIDDGIAHSGQAAYVRGLVERGRGQDGP